MDLKQSERNDWCQNDFDSDDIHQSGPSESKHSTDHFLIGGMKFKNIDFIKDSFVNDNIVLTDNNGRPYDVLTNSDMDSMTVLDNQSSGFEMTKLSQSSIITQYNSMSEVGTMVSIPDQYFQNDLYNLKPNHLSEVSHDHSVMGNLTNDSSLVQIDSMCMIQKPTSTYINNLGNNQEMILDSDSNRFLFSENGNNYIEVTLKEGDVISGVENGFYVLPRTRSIQGSQIGQKIVTMDDLNLLTSPKTHHNVELLVNHEELVDDIDTCDIAVVDESHIPINNSQIKDRLDETSQSISLDIHHQHHTSGFQRMSKEAIEKIAEEFVRQPQGIEEDISINFISKINNRTAAISNYWCEECNKVYLNETSCPLHQVNSIIDPAVQTRARASLPSSHLRIMKVKSSDNINKYGVFARKIIQKRTQFGPLEGIVIKDEDCMNESINDEFKYLLEVDENQFRRIDVSSEDNSNWMCFVRPAKTKQDQNMRVDQIGDYLFFTTTKTIYQREELLVGYSTFYAHKRGLPILSSDNNQVMLTQFRKPFKPLKALQEINKKTHTIGKSPKTNTGKIIVTTCKHVTKKRLATNRLAKNIQCNLCLTSQTSSKVPLKSKLKTDKSLRNIWMCTACDLKFTKRETILIHNKIHDDDFDGKELTSVETNCPECQTEFTQAEELIKHVSAHSFTGGALGCVAIYNCQQCERRYRNTNHLKAHQAKHKVDELKPFKCNMCDKRFLNTVTLTCHVRTHFEGVIYDCPICRLTFVDLKSLREHVYTHAVNNIFHCQMCTSQFKTYKLIRKHIRARHNGVKFACDYCNRLFNSRFSLALHMLSHSDQKDFLCTMCGKQFKRKDKLKAHMNRIHLGKKKNSKTNDKILEASRTSKQDKQVKLKSPKSILDYENSVFRCDKCVVGFKKRGVFVNHLVSRHPEIDLDSVPSLNQPVGNTTKIYVCLYCDKVYKTNAKRKSHILKNHPNCDLPQKPTEKTVIIDSEPSGKKVNKPQVHSCQWCYKQYVLKDKLLKHQRANHCQLLPDFLQVPKNTKKSGSKTKKTEQNYVTTEQHTQTINLQFTDTEGFELTATDVQLDNPIEPGSIITIKRTIKALQENRMLSQEDSAEFLSHSIGDLDMTETESKDGLNEEQQLYYRILETQGDVAYVQAIDPPQSTSLITLDGQTIQQVLYSCDPSIETAPDAIQQHSPQPSTSSEV
ncbi:PR domain zinc finger protein 10-like [Daktulosphaira vitifoliae]|uniref:PR domain zinc finger protein 10-like n=1 Tax=Daktulosphaira vitifoliae TaxID=58002 RepID=UPI0021AA04F9|nr:PR domain zinc finger protein 10-like [Daktulosphaira vitifoliae]